MAGQYDWFLKIGATQQAVNTLNDQPYLVIVLVVVILVLALEMGLAWYIHFATMKPEQKKKKEKKGAKAGPPAKK